MPPANRAGMTTTCGRGTRGPAATARPRITPWLTAARRTPPDVAQAARSLRSVGCARGAAARARAGPWHRALKSPKLEFRWPLLPLIIIHIIAPIPNGQASTASGARLVVIDAISKGSSSARYLTMECSSPVASMTTPFTRRRQRPSSVRPITARGRLLPCSTGSPNPRRRGSPSQMDGTFLPAPAARLRAS